MSFRRIIRAEVARRGLSGYRVAKLAEVSMRSVQAYLAGERDLAGERLARIAEALGLELRPRRRRKGG